MINLLSIQGQETKSYVPFIILGGIAIIAGLATLALPETMGKKLPDSVAQAESLSSLDDRDEEEEKPKYGLENGNGIGAKDNPGFVGEKGVNVTML